MKSNLPILFIAGPSGVGKSALCRQLENNFRFLHLDIDQRGNFDVYDLRAAWGEFISCYEIAPLAAAIRLRATDIHAGIILSLPSGCILTRQHIDSAKPAGIVTIVLWGDEELCKEARRTREWHNGLDLNEQHYELKNRQAFNIYAAAEYDEVRIQTFHPDGSRVPMQRLLREVMQRLNHPVVRQSAGPDNIAANGFAWAGADGFQLVIKS